MKSVAAVEGASLESVVGRLAEEYTERINSGEQPEIDEYVNRYPQYAEAIRQVLGALEAVRALSSDTAGRAGIVDSDRSTTDQMGDYRIIREAGRGGMGVVYEAEQVSLGRRVALKILPFAAVLDQRQLQRFKNEAQAAAQLHHTNIVPVFSVGCERGVHYYAMQYIEGSTLADVIHELCLMADPEAAQEEHPASRASELATDLTLTTGRFARPKGSSTDAKLDEQAPAAEGSSAALAAIAPEHSVESPAFFRSVANLGIQAAEALDHAHESGVIHRDIKPSNLLLDLRGNLWITDFGLARLESDPGLTMTGDILGTVRYMSPEQALAKRIPIDHRTDIYSLGVTLYELLTLQPAFTGRDRQELLRQIAFEEPRQPRRLNRAIPTELETIVLKAFNKNPEQRYATAQDLADDLERFLEDKPIKAKRPSLMERAGKWSRRHRTVVAAGVVVLVMAVAALSVSTVLIWQEQARTQAALQKAEDAAQVAETNYERAREVVAEMARMAEEELVNVPQMEQVRRRKLEDALAFYQSFLEERGADPSVRYETGQAFRRVGDADRTLGEAEAAESAYREAINLLEKLADDFPHVPEYTSELADSYMNLGLLMEWRQLEAEAACEQATGLLERLIAQYPDAADHRASLARVQIGLGTVALDPDVGGDALRRGLALFEELTAQYPDNRDYLEGLAVGLNKLGDRLLYGGRLGDPQVATQAQQMEESKAAYDRALAIYENLVRDYPTMRLFREGLTWSHHNLGWWERVKGNLAAAERSYRDVVLPLGEDLAGDFPGIPKYRAWLSHFHRDLACVLREIGDSSESQLHEHRAAELGQELAADFPYSPEARSIIQLAQLIGPARESPTGVAGVVEQVRSTDTESMLTSPHALLYGDFLILGGRPDRGAAVIQQAIKEGGAAGGKGHCHYKSLGWALASAGRDEEAEAAFKQALAGFESWSPEPPERADIDHWTAAYFLDLVTSDQYTMEGEGCRLWGWAYAPFPWFYVGQRAEIEGRIDDAIAAYEKAVELGQLPNAHYTANFAAYRLQVLRGERTEDESDN